jgi:hypothetical protein
VIPIILMLKLGLGLVMIPTWWDCAQIKAAEVTGGSGAHIPGPLLRTSVVVSLLLLCIGILSVLDGTIPRLLILRVPLFILLMLCLLLICCCRTELDCDRGKCTNLTLVKMRNWLLQLQGAE